MIWFGVTIANFSALEKRIMINSRYQTSLTVPTEVPFYSCRRLCASILLLLIMGCQVYPQEGSQQPIHIARYDIGGSGLDGMMEYTTSILEYFKDYPSSTVVLSLCTKKPLPIAIATAAIEPLTLARYLSHYYVPVEKIVVSRAAFCSGKLATNTATDLWMVLPTNRFPKMIDSVKVCQIKIRELKSRQDASGNIRIGTNNYLAAANKLVSELKANPKATGVIVGYYIGEPPQAILKKLKRVQRLLKRSGLAPARYYVRPLHWTGFPEVEDQLGHLSIELVEIDSVCQELGEKNGVIWID